MGNNNRLETALPARWRLFERNVSKFCSAFAAIDNNNESGSTFDEKVQDSCTLYQSHNKVPFTMLPLWLLLHSPQKWKNGLKKPKGKTVAHHNLLLVQSDKVSDNGTNMTNNTNNRPIGRKLSKRKREEAKNSLAEGGHQMAEES
jgi:hypothetical protein